MDNATWHRSEKIKAKIQQWEENNLYFFYLPVYSPHLNPAETLWRKIKLEWLKPKDYTTAKQLEEAVLNILKNYDHEFAIKFAKKII
jgi:transposase